MYNFGDEFAKGLILPKGSAADAVAVRDGVRNAIAEAFIGRVFTQGNQMSLLNVDSQAADKMQREVLAGVKKDFARQYSLPQFRSLKPGASTTINGQPVQFLDIDVETGKAIIRAPKTVAKATNNL